MSGFIYEKDQDGIVTVTMDMTGPVNAMNAEFDSEMGATVEKLEAEEGLTGVVFASAKKVFFAGGDLNELVKAEDTLDYRKKFRASVENMKSLLRRLEKLPAPVVAAINGAALGGGYELCLACNHRIAWANRSVQIGLPEVQLGLFPGGGGVVRLTNKIGIEKSAPYILEAKRVKPDRALADNLIEATVDTLEELVPAAKQWILDNKDNEEAAVQPWDRKGFKVPGGKYNAPRNAQLSTMAPTMLHQKTRGLMPQASAALDVSFQSTVVDFDTALRIEGREFARIATGPVAKNMINTFFFGLNKINGGASRPDVPKNPTKKVGVLGAGMMGQGIAYVAAKAGIEVVLKDISVEAAERGKAYSQKLVEKAKSRGRMDDAKAQALLDLIKPTDNNDDLKGCDLVIEAVFENVELKNKIVQETEHVLSDDGFWGSNTSTLPITQLQTAAKKPENFVGIHFFSPVDKMPLVEIIVGDNTSDEAVAKAFDFTLQIKKTPIVVNDSLGFFTSRTFGTYLDEGGHLLTEGVHPIKIDTLGKEAGMPVGPLQVHDEVSLELTRKAGETWEGMGVADKWYNGDNTRRLINDLVIERGRKGKDPRHGSAGFYDYDENGKRSAWPGLLDLYYKEDNGVSDQDVKDRLLFRQVIETLKCLQTNVLRSVADGNIGSVFGIGAPPHTGGFLQFINTYGLQAFADRCAELAAKYGDRFDCPQIVQDKIAAGEDFS